jgi:hypothetical protein
VSVDAVIARVAQLNSLFAPPAVAPAATATTTAATPPAGTGANATFASLIGQTTAASGTAGAGGSPIAGGTPAGQAMVSLARQEVGVAEQPPGSNDSPRIAQYRQATAGSGVGPWCAYFASWAARNAGAPLGDQGQGFGSVSDVWSWAQRAGKAIEPGTQPPQTGDLIVWGGRHVGIVESVDPDGSIHTIEGNSSDKVSRRTYGPDGGGATGFVRLG